MSCALHALSLVHAPGSRRGITSPYPHSHNVNLGVSTIDPPSNGGGSHEVELACAACCVCMQNGEELKHVAVDAMCAPCDKEGTTTAITDSTPSSQDVSDAVSGADNESSVLLPVQGALHPESMDATRRIPWFAWPLLLASLASVSSAGVIFASLPEVPTFTLAAWRLQTTGFLLVPGAIYQYVNIPAGATAVLHLLPAVRSGQALFDWFSLCLQVTDSAFTKIFCSFWLLGPFLEFTSLFGSWCADW